MVWPERLHSEAKPRLDLADAPLLRFEFQHLANAGRRLIDPTDPPGCEPGEGMPNRVYTERSRDSTSPAVCMFPPPVEGRLNRKLSTATPG